MSKIQVLIVEEKLSDTLIDGFKAYGWKVFYIENQPYKNLCDEHHEKTIIIIQQKKELAEICETIFTIRKRLGGMVWLGLPELTRSQRMIYLQLGVNGFLNVTDESEEVLFFFNNLVSRVEADKTRIEKSMTKKKVDFELNESNLSVVFNGDVEISLTRSEYLLFHSLLEKSPQALTYNELSEKVWGNSRKDDGHLRIANIVCHIRHKLSSHGIQPSFIKTVRTKGYKVTNL